MSIHEAVQSIPENDGIDYLRQYYSPGQFTGAHFNSLANDNEATNIFTPGDLYAVSTLAVTVPAKAGIALLEDQAEEFNGMLGQIPTRELKDLSEDEFGQHLGPESAAQKLWDSLRRNDPSHERWKVGPTTASKIMARKRPHLIPIEDSVLDRAINRGRQNSWKLWWEALRTDGYLEQRAIMLRDAVGRPELSTLRVLDVLLWMANRNG